jgi:hypothetical protein
MKIGRLVLWVAGLVVIAPTSLFAKLQCPYFQIVLTPSDPGPCDTVRAKAFVSPCVRSPDRPEGGDEVDASWSIEFLEMGTAAESGGNEVFIDEEGGITVGPNAKPGMVRVRASYPNPIENEPLLEAQTSFYIQGRSGSGYGAAAASGAQGCRSCGTLGAGTASLWGAGMRFDLGKMRNGEDAGDISLYLPTPPSVENDSASPGLLQAPDRPGFELYPRDGDQKDYTPVARVRQLFVPQAIIDVTPDPTDPYKYYIKLYDHPDPWAPYWVWNPDDYVYEPNPNSLPRLLLTWTVWRPETDIN